MDRRWVLYITTEPLALEYLLSAPLGAAAAATEFASVNSTTTISGAGEGARFCFRLTDTYNTALTGNNGIAAKAGASHAVTLFS